MVEQEQVSRAERRRRTEESILAAARRQFGESGYERTSIRGVATEAGIDAALVMQMFGSKERLFAEAASSGVDLLRLVGATADDLAEAAATHLFADFEDPGRRPGVEALLRSCLTHPAAGAALRDQVTTPTQAAVAATIGGDDGELRAAVLNACTLGVTIARYLLHDPILAKADRDDVARVLRPALEAIVRLKAEG
ncbi:TetR family transcriptional regulator [Kribbella sp. DT2]|uniref:TetR/AcrR family transcriptional regulator n=1 Tax=Kribbella sp. DT2 TaxID=3393427 RepID=UPI003CE7CA9A